MNFAEITIGGLTIYEIVWFFLIYSFLGWILEVVYHAASKGLIVNRGFLNGPVCPIYGFGMISILILLNSFFPQGAININLIVLFGFGLVLSTIIELFGGWALDKLYHARWWDYSDKPFNLNGYICPEFSLYWGLGTVVAVRMLHPCISEITVNNWPKQIAGPVATVFCAILAADVTVTVMIVMGLNKKLAELDEIKASMRTVSDELSTVLGNSSIETIQRLEERRVQSSLARDLLKERAGELSQDMHDKVQGLLDKEAELKAKEEALYKRLTKGRVFGPRRLFRAFPDLKIPDHSALLEDLRERL